MRECLEKQALKRGGVIAVEENTMRPELSFSHDKIEVAVSILLGRNFVTYATFQCEFFPDKNFRFGSKHFRAVFSSPRMKESSGDLFPRFGMEGNSASFVKSLLTQEIQTNLLQYDEATEIKFGNYGGINNLVLKPNPGRFFVSVYGNKVEDKDYDQLIATAVLFYERLKFMSGENSAFGAIYQ